MRAYEFIKPILREYKRDVTINTFKQKILDTIKNKSHYDNRRILSKDLGYYNPETNTYNDDEIIRTVFNTFEKGDPTFKEDKTGGIYIPWIAREYSKGNIQRLEDVLSNVRSTLYDYHDYKKLRGFPNEFKDIMRVDYKTLASFIAKYTPPIDEKNKGKSKVYYEDDTVRVIIPLDEEAACYYGQGTIWCTAATKSRNYFDSYNNQGPLYIILPKKPEYTGEKYEFHPSTGEYMDEDNDPIDLSEILLKRFPKLGEYMSKTIPEIKLSYSFTPDKVIEDLVKMILPELLESAYEYIYELESNDHYYNDYLRDYAKRNGYYDEENDEIDYDKMYSDNPDLGYTDYNETARDLINSVKGLDDYSGGAIKGYYNSINLDSDDMSSNLDEVLRYIINNDYYSSYRRNSGLPKHLDEKLNDITIDLNKPRFNPNREFRIIGEVPLDDTDKYIVGVMGAFKKKS